MSLAYVAQEEVYNVVAYGFGLGCECLERSCLLWNAALHYAYKFLRVEFQIFLAYASAHRYEWNRLTVRIFGTFILVVQMAHAWVVESVELQYHTFCNTYNGRNDAVG